MNKRALTGVRTSGEVHIGNYLAVIKPAIAMQSDYECFYFLADLHALNTVKNADEMRSNIYQQTAIWLACGLDTKKNYLYAPSRGLPHADLAWILCCHAGMGFLEKAHAYKDAKAKNKDLNVGLFYYPILMAADILLYSPDIVPVGKDQKQHVEMARDLAGTINNTYGKGKELLKLPEPLIDDKVMTIPGLDGQKMSKSYNNTIPLMLPEKQLRKKVMSIATDSSGIEDAKTMERTPLGQLFKLFAEGNEYQDLESRLQAGGLGWGHAKEELFQAMNREISPLREKYLEIVDDHGYLEKILAEGTAKAKVIADQKLHIIKKAVGLA